MGHADKQIVKSLLRGRLKVGRQVLALKIEVRVLAPQPSAPFLKGKR